MFKAHCSHESFLLRGGPCSTSIGFSEIPPKSLDIYHLAPALVENFKRCRNPLFFVIILSLVLSTHCSATLFVTSARRGSFLTLLLYRFIVVQNSFFRSVPIKSPSDTSTTDVVGKVFSSESFDSLAYLSYSQITPN